MTIFLSIILSLLAVALVIGSFVMGFVLRGMLTNLKQSSVSQESNDVLARFVKQVVQATENKSRPKIDTIDDNFFVTPLTSLNQEVKRNDR